MFPEPDDPVVELNIQYLFNNYFPQSSCWQIVEDIEEDGLKYMSITNWFGQKLVYNIACLVDINKASQDEWLW